MTMAQEVQKCNFDRHTQVLPTFKEGNKVWLDANYIITDRPSRKPLHRHLGPYPVTKIILPHAYHLKLPVSMHVHPVFHVSLLHAHITDTIPGQVQPPPPPVITAPGQEEWEVDVVLNSRYHHGKLQYLIQWTGYGIQEESWKPAENLTNAPDALKEFHWRNPLAFSPMHHPQPGMSTRAQQHL